MPDKGHNVAIRHQHSRDTSTVNNDFVLDKDIFSNVFEKDIRRVFIYKKAERLAKAIHLVTPAFPAFSALRNRIDAIAVALVDGATLPPASARIELSRQLLTLSSVLSIARSSSLLSSMNTDLISREAHTLLGEIASYEEPRLFLDDALSFAELAKEAGKNSEQNSLKRTQPARQRTIYKGHIKDIAKTDSRRDAILEIIRSKGTVYIKDVSPVIRDVSEKTIQRELLKLVQEGVVRKEGERRWTAYSLAS